MITLLLEPTLLPRHFPCAAITRRHLALWSNLRAASPNDRDPGRWRFFAPAEVLALGVLDDLVANAPMQILGDTPFLAFLRDFGRFVEPVLTCLKTNEDPILLTDLSQDFRVLPNTDQAKAMFVKDARFACAFRLKNPFDLMTKAVKAGGSEAQRELVNQIIGYRHASINAESTATHELKPDLEAGISETPVQSGRHVRL
jgi:hypothetical protein